MAARRAYEVPDADDDHFVPNVQKPEIKHSSRTFWNSRKSVNRAVKLQREKNLSDMPNVNNSRVPTPRTKQNFREGKSLKNKSVLSSTGEVGQSPPLSNSDAVRTGMQIRGSPNESRFMQNLDQPRSQLMHHVPSLPRLYSLYESDEEEELSGNGPVSKPPADELQSMIQTVNERPKKWSNDDFYQSGGGFVGYIGMYRGPRSCTNSEEMIENVCQRLEKQKLSQAVETVTDEKTMQSQ